MKVRINRMLTGLMGLALLSGCSSSLPARYIQQAESDVTLTSLMKSPGAYHGKTVILGGVVVDQQQDGQRLWLHVRNRPLDKDYRPHRPIVNEGPEAGYYWISVPNAVTLPPRWKQWARVTVVGRVTDPKTAAPSIEPVLNLVFMRGWTMGQAQQGGAREESVGANNLLSVPEGLHGE